MGYFIDVAPLSINKYGEELCGDQIEILDTKEGKIMVLSDGLGSGVKANILATLTSKIAVTMLKEEATLEDTLETILATLPICSVRKLSYSTFTILQISEKGEVSIVEFDNPSFFLFKGGKINLPKKKRREIHGKVLFESNFYMVPGDYLTIISDGIVHAGVGRLLNLGWQWENICAYIESLYLKKEGAGMLSHELIGHTQILYDLKPGDDASVLTITLKEKQTLNLFTGPPKNPSQDSLYVEEFKKAHGLKVVSGGTTANIISSWLETPLIVDLSGINSKLPPIATMEGADLVTEGILTLSEVLSILKEYAGGSQSIELISRLREDDAASKLVKLILDEATEITIWHGTAVNPAHQEGAFTYNYTYKISLINELKSALEALGRKVTLVSI